MEAAGQSAHSRGQAGIHMGLGRGDFPAGKGRSIQGVLRLENHGDFEIPRHRSARSLAGELPEEIAGVRQLRIGRQRNEPVAYAVPGRNHGSHARNDPHRFALVRRPRLDPELRVRHSEERHRGLQHIHGGGASRPALEALGDEAGQISGIPHLFTQRQQTSLVGQIPIE
jgi:hypothetical protein